MKPLKFSFLFYSLFLFIGMYIEVSVSTYLIVVGGVIMLLLTSVSILRRFLVLPSTFTFIKDVSVFASLFFLLGIGMKSSITEVDKHFLGEIDIFLKDYKRVRVGVKITDIVKSKDSRQFYADIIRVEDIVVKGKIALYFNTNQHNLNVGDLISYHSNLKLIEPPRNIGQFDYKRYMKGKGIYVQSYVNEYELVGAERDWRYKVLEWRGDIINTIHLEDNLLSNDAKALLTALLLGEKSYIDREVISQFKDVGVMHVLAISGLHVGLLYIVLFWTFSFLPHRYRQVVILLALWFFVFLSGFSPSVFRAVFMFSVFTICRLIRREQSLEHSIGLALFFSLCVYPQWVYDIGFQLSYLAVISIVYFMPLFKKYYAKNRMFKYIQGIVYVSVSVQIGLIPLQMYYFHQFSLTFLLANLVVIPLVTVLVILGIVYLCSMWLKGVSDVLGWLFSRFTDVLYYSIRLVSDIDYLSFNQLKLSSYQFLLLISIIILSTLAYYRQKISYVVVSLCVFTMFQLGFLIGGDDMEKEKFEVVIPYQSKVRDELTIWVREENTLNMMSNQWDTLSRSILTLESYKQEYSIEQVKYSDIKGMVPNRGNDIVVLTKEYVDYNLAVDNPIILLAQQPKINFERMLDVSVPALVVFHNSVPFWYKRKCIAICVKKNIPFHDMYEKGYWSSLL
ncbi:ComEC/Rec2 family competence protein [Myroides marinus]|uniref:ComEC/Rec2 family competence protein n=1 Tax=Myroides marinus TaxID=703342 RepID=UPI002574C872|nr:ComEC/Rec2 family competence protein [Myroides marinus]MDM1368925.1 ComEC/Rec2 family competence protein [Myroides marinus]MDM1371871.1 ComEC/Rec2 family competence protein [Myroides marinus]MDM1375593.1 ComEC/Rec2 family competence protein [Myroides marinus]MDM1382819.1 ComEC/Rec2 family competence protein [Myroides marinus]MDM1390133.1 ComEC/Rec2 family competence protein [Myroides marinus]